MKRGAPLRNKTPMRRKTPLRASNRFPSKGDPGAAAAANVAVPVSLEAQPRFPKPRRERASLQSRTRVDRREGKRASAQTGGAAVGDAVQSASLPSLALPKPQRRPRAAPKPMPRSRMKAKRARRIDRETPREKLFKDWIHRQECVGVKHITGHVCSGRIEQSHLRSVAHGSGTGIKLDNFMSAAKCWGLAREWDVNQGPFDRWTKTERREWLLDRITETRARFDAEHPEAA